MSEENQQAWEYINNEDLIDKPSFARSNKAGYVEDSVDIWVDEVRQRYTDLANTYNELVHKLGLAEASLAQSEAQISNLKEANQRLMNSKGGPTQEELDEAAAELEAVKNQYNELLDNYESVHARNAELEAAAGETPAATTPTVIHSYDRQASAEDGYTYVLEYTHEGNIATVREFPELRATGKNAEHALSNLMDDVDEVLAALQAEGSELPQPGDYEVAEASTAVMNLDTTKVEALMKAAAEEASEHVQRTQANMLRLEEAARREAESIVADANREAEESREELARNRAQSAKIRERMVLLFESQLSELKSYENSVGYDPTVSPDASELRRDQ